MCVCVVWLGIKKNAKLDVDINSVNQNSCSFDCFIVILDSSAKVQSAENLSFNMHTEKLMERRYYQFWIYFQFVCKSIVGVNVAESAQKQSQSHIFKEISWREDQLFGFNKIFLAKMKSIFVGDFWPIISFNSIRSQ